MMAIGGGCTTPGEREVSAILPVTCRHDGADASGPTRRPTACRTSSGERASSSCSCRVSTSTSPAASTTPSTSGPACSSSIAPTTGPAPTSTGRGARRPSGSARPRRWSHQGLQAFDAGDVEQARRLLTSALEHGAAARTGAAGAAPHRAAGLAGAGPAGAAAARAGGGRRDRRPSRRASRGAGWPLLAAAGDERGRACGSSCLERRTTARPAARRSSIRRPASCRCLAPRRPTSSARRRCSPPGACPMRWPSSSGSRPGDRRLSGRAGAARPDAAGAAARRRPGHGRGRRADAAREVPEVRLRRVRGDGALPSLRLRLLVRRGGGRAGRAGRAAIAAVRRRAMRSSARGAELAPPPTDRLGFAGSAGAARGRRSRRRSTPSRAARAGARSPRRRRHRPGRRWRCGAGPIGRAAGRPRKSCGVGGQPARCAAAADAVGRDGDPDARHRGRRSLLARIAAGIIDLGLARGHRDRGRLPHRAAVGADHGAGRTSLPIVPLSAFLLGLALPTWRRSPAAAARRSARWRSACGSSPTTARCRPGTAVLRALVSLAGAGDGRTRRPAGALRRRAPGRCTTASPAPAWCARSVTVRPLRARHRLGRLRRAVSDRSRHGRVGGRPAGLVGGAGRPAPASPTNW